MPCSCPCAKAPGLIGVLFVQSRVAGAYSDHDLETLQTLADQCGGALERVNAEEALRESQRRFRDLFENSPDAIFVVDLNGMVLDVNLASCLLHGLTPGAADGQKSFDRSRSGVPPGAGPAGF